MKSAGEVLVPAGALIWMGGMLLGGYEILYWLKNGFWSGHTLATLFDNLVVRDWSGATQILVWLWAQPLWGVIACAGIVIALIGIAYANS